MARKTMSMIAVATLMAQSALAITPPLGPPEYSAYGALQICAADFQVDVGADEAVHIVGNVTRLLRDDYMIAAVPVTLSPETLGKSITIPIILDGGQTAHLFTAPTPDPDREVLFAPDALGPDDIRYAVSVSGDDSRFIIIGSTAFKGDISDKNILARIFSTEAKSADCITPRIAWTLRFFSSDTSKTTKHAQEKQAYQAKLYPPKPDVGRDFYCMGGIGFALKPGEILHRPWKSLGEAAEARVSIGGVTIKIRGPMEPLRRVDENDIKEHPLGLLHQSRIIYYPSRGLGPPYAATGVREDGSWAIELGKYPRQTMFFDFPASDKTPVGFEFLERLQFVEKSDSSCM